MNYLINDCVTEIRELKSKSPKETKQAQQIFVCLLIVEGKYLSNKKWVKHNGDIDSILNQISSINRKFVLKRMMEAITLHDKDILN